MKLASLIPALLAGLFFSGSTVFSAEASARITRVWLEKGNVQVEVQPGAKALKVTLESSTRVGRRSWEPRAVRYLTNSEPENAAFTFSVPASPQLEILRVRSDLIENTLPASFYAGTNKFVSGSDNSAVYRGGPVTASPGTDGATTGADQRAVVESDIWKLDGDRLFFFNQYRGLQVLDVSTPDSPVLTGSYDVPAAGEQMYLMEHTKVVLLAHDNCAWFGSEAESRLLLLEVRNGVPELVKSIPVAGQIAESRLVGSALYVVANSWRVSTKPGGTVANETWEWGTEVTSYDLSDFANSSRKSSDWVTGYGNVITATDKYLFVAQMDYTSSQSRSIVQSYDISAPDGAFSKLASFELGGTVRDKFKMHMMGNIFVAVVQENTRPSGTYVSTFSFADPRKPVQLAHLKVIENEQLFATRFDGERLYLVTFFLVDPLWIIDLSNPALPKKVGELEIPGWSTYLQPLGDKLLAIGLDRTNGYQRTAVQLFDVANPAKPALLSKVVIGDQWSGSEANWDEKAFGVLPDDNLILVPFHSSSTNGFYEGVQLIDLFPDHLAKRGIVNQNMGARRATLHKSRILSLSSRELLSVDATDRDNPRITRTTELSWSADQVLLAGDYVVEVDAYRGEGPIVRIVDAANTENIRGSITLTNLPYLGSTIYGGKLVVLQGKSFEYVYPQVYDPNNYQPIATNPAVYLLSSFDLSQLPNLRPTGSALKESMHTEYLNGRYRAVEVKPGVLVWSSENGSGPIYLAQRAVLDAVAAPVGGAAPIARSIFGWGNSGHLLATDANALAFLSEISLRGTNGWWSFSETFTTNNLLYLSHSVNEYDTTIDPPPLVWEYYDGTRNVKVTNDPPAGAWVQRSFLDVVDFSDPADPLVRKPASIPGTLIGIDHAGEVVFTRGYNLAMEESIAAATYDGVEAHLLDSFTLGNAWPRPVKSNFGHIYAGIPGTNNASGRLESWTLGATGKFELESALELKQPIQQFGLFNRLLAAQAERIWLFDVTDSSKPKPIGDGKANACYGAQLEAADGSVERGLWLPMGWFGVTHIPVDLSTLPSPGQ